MEVNYYSMESKIVNNQKGKRKRTRIDFENLLSNQRRNYRYPLFFIPRRVNSRFLLLHHKYHENL